MKHVNLVPCGGWRMRSVGPGLVALALAAMAVAAPVHAADLPVAPAYNPPAPMPPAIYNWTGFYLGGNVGAGLLSENMTPTSAAAPGSTPASRSILPSSVSSAAPKPATIINSRP